MTTKKKPPVKEYSISYPIHGHVHVLVEATSEEEAVSKGYEEAGGEDSELEWECGYPCHTGWPEFKVTNVEDIE